MHRAGKAIYFTDRSLNNARALRREMTEIEKKLWYYLRRKNILDVRFRKQVPIGNYIVDFAAHNPKLIVELDGGQHSEQQAYDAARDTWLQKQGFCILRFWNNDVIENLEGVLERIALKINELRGNAENAPLPTSPLKGGGADWSKT